MMPNRTIYVADADLPIFEKAQELAGDNLSATISAALRRFVAEEEARASGFQEITVKVGKNVHFLKRFMGRLLAKGRTSSQDNTREVSYSVYHTMKGKLAVYIRDYPNWTAWSGKGRYNDWSYRGWHQRDWSHWPMNEYDHRLEVYETLDELKDKVPEELYEAVAHALKGDPDGAEFLDI